MEKSLRSRRAPPGRDQNATETPAPPAAGTLDRSNRTFISAVLFLDIVEYSKKTVAEQLKIKEQFTARIAQAIQEIPVNDRIVLDTGDGVAINFLDDPEDALFVALHLAHGFAATPEGEPRPEVRIGVNFGPVRLVRDATGQPNIIGDAINVAERVMSFAGTGQMLVSRSYYEAITRGSEELARLFAYQGSRTDKHVREHEIYELAGIPDQALDIIAARRRARSASESRLAAPVDRTSARGRSSRLPWLANRGLAYLAATLSLAALLAAVAFQVIEPGAKPAPKVARPAVVQPAKLPEPPTPPAPVVAEAPSTVPVASEPPKPAAPSPAKKESPARKVPRLKAQTHKPSPPKRAAPVARAERPAAPTQSAAPKAAAIEERPLLSMAGNQMATAPKVAAGPTALVMFAISPWGEIVLDGKSAGVSPPLSELELAPGRHRIEIRNGSFKPYLETFELEANQTVRIKYKFKER